MVGAGFREVSYQVDQERADNGLHTAGEDAFDMLSDIGCEISGCEKFVDILVKVEKRATKRRDKQEGIVEIYNPRKLYDNKDGIENNN